MGSLQNFTSLLGLLKGRLMYPTFSNGYIPNGLNATFLPLVLKKMEVQSMNETPGTFRVATKQ